MVDSMGSGKGKKSKPTHVARGGGLARKEKRLLTLLVKKK